MNKLLRQAGIQEDDLLICLHVINVARPILPHRLARSYRRLEVRRVRAIVLNEQSGSLDTVRGGGRVREADGSLGRHLGLGLHLGLS